MMRILHTMIRTGDLDRSIGFYTKMMGMTLMRKQDYPDGKFTLAFLGYGDENEQAVLELTYNWGVDHYDMGSGYGHVAIEVDDVYASCDKIRRLGGKVIREAGPMKGGTKAIAFISDPDGYLIELIGKRT